MSSSNTTTSQADSSSWVQIGAASALAATGRLHTCIKGRYVSVLSLNGRLTCIDSICFHAGGPLSLGDIEDVAGKTCLVCPWHDYKIDVCTGEKYYQAVTWKDGKMQPGGWNSQGRRQRVHEVEQRADGLVYVRLDNSPDPLTSDEYAYNTACGSRIVNSPNTPSARSAAAVGADGKRTAVQGLLRSLGPRPS